MFLYLGFIYEASYSLLTHLFFSQLVGTKEQKEKGWHILQFKECLFFEGL